MRFLYFFVLLFFLNLQSQERKSIEAYKFINPPTIDGILSESEWKNIKAADNFTLIMPDTKAGEKIPKGYESRVYLGYDNNAIYVGAQLNHPDPKNIPSEFSQRDQIFGVKSEAFWISLDTYDDRINHFGFIVTSSGTIGDSFSSGEFNEESLNYDTVFDAKIQVNDDGWSVEVIIPYSAQTRRREEMNGPRVGQGRDRAPWPGSNFLLHAVRGSCPWVDALAAD